MADGPMSTPRRDWPRSRGAPMIDTGRCIARNRTGWREPDLNRRHHGFQPCALPTELPRRVAAGSIALHKKRRPDRCYRVANVSVIGRLRPTGQKCNAWTRPEVRYVQEAAPLELAPDTFEGHPDRR